MTTRPCLPPQPPPAVVAKLPALQSLMVPHNKLGGRLACSLLASGKLAALDVTGGWLKGESSGCSSSCSCCCCTGVNSVPQ